MRVAAILLGGLVIGACSLSLDHSLIEDGGKGSGGVTGADASDASDAKTSDSPTQCSADCGKDSSPPDAPISDANDVSVDTFKCTISGGLAPACTDCGEKYCCSDWNACATDGPCIALAGCMAQNCASDISQSCADANCAANSSAFPTYKTAADCFAQNCAAECSGGG